MAPFCFIQCRAAEVSSPPEKAMPTFWPTGRDSRITDMLGTSKQGLGTKGLGARKNLSPLCFVEKATPFERKRMQRPAQSSGHTHILRVLAGCQLLRRIVESLVR